MNDSVVVGMNFGEAIEALKLGSKVAREGWNGKRMFIFLTKGMTVAYEDIYKDNFKEIFKGQDSCTIGSHIDMKAADGSVVIGWLASQTDMLAEDWLVVE